MATHLLLLFGWLLATMADDPQPTYSIRVMTYNIRTDSEWAKHYGGDITHRRTWNRRRTYVSKTIKTSRAAVVGTQEGLDHQIDWLAKDLKFDRVGSARGSENEGENEFAALLYNSAVVDLVKSGDFWLSSTPEMKGSTSWDTTLPRVATWAIFQDKIGRATTFAVINSHFDHTSIEAREKSALLIRSRANRIREICGDNCPIFLTADFNGRKTESYYKVLTSIKTASQGFFDAWNVAARRTCGSCGQSTFHNWGGSALPNQHWIEPKAGKESKIIAETGKQHIDGVLILHQKGSSQKLIGNVSLAKMLTDDKRIFYLGGVHASDHYPVVIEYRWETSSLGLLEELPKKMADEL